MERLAPSLIFRAIDGLTREKLFIRNCESVGSSVSFSISASRPTRRRTIRSRLSSFAFTVGLLLVVGSLIVAVRPEVVWGFQHAFFPVPSKWAFCGVFFLVGVMLAIHDPNLQRLGTGQARWVSPAAMLAIATVILGRWYLAGGDGVVSRAALGVMSVGSAAAISMRPTSLPTSATSVSRPGSARTALPLP